MQTQFAYAAATDTFEGGGFEPTVLDEVRAHGRIGGGDRANSTSAGIKGLKLAVLEDGIRSFLSSNRMRRDEAEAWMTMRVHNWPFSFVNVCHTLGLEPTAVRQALRVMRERNPTRRTRISRSRPNVRRKGRIRPSERRRRSRSTAPQEQG
jgi:hypothetical protein